MSKQKFQKKSQKFQTNISREKFSKKSKLKTFGLCVSTEEVGRAQRRPVGPQAKSRARGPFTSSF